MGVQHTGSLPSLAEDIHHRIITPYIADAYDSLLLDFGLTEKYSDLTFNMRHGFPIGDMPPLTRTYTPKNHRSAEEHPEIIRDYCNDEVKLGRMSGPFSKEDTHRILGGHFVSSPLGLVEKSGEPGKFRIVRDLSYENEDGFAVNKCLDADDFPTEWGTAAQIAEIVSFVSSFELARRCGARQRDVVGCIV